MHELMCSLYIIQLPIWELSVRPLSCLHRCIGNRKMYVGVYIFGRKWWSHLVLV